MPYSAKGAFKAIVDADRALSAAVANLNHAQHLRGVALDEMTQFLKCELYDISRCIDAEAARRGGGGRPFDHRTIADALECSPSSVSEWRRGRPITGKRLAKMLYDRTNLIYHVHLIRPLP